MNIPPLPDSRIAHQSSSDPQTVLFSSKWLGKAVTWVFDVFKSLGKPLVKLMIKINQMTSYFFVNKEKCPSGSSNIIRQGKPRENDRHFPSQPPNTLKKKNIIRPIILSQPETLQIENARSRTEQTEVISINPTQKITATLGLINVPDDGNCLFYSLAIGLKKKQADNRTVQETLHWMMNENDLIGDLSQAYERLNEPGATLRSQAADYLKTNKDHQNISHALTEGILSHRDVEEIKINDERALLSLLYEEMLEQQEREPRNERLLEETRNQIQLIEASIQQLEHNLPDPSNIEEYIERTKTSGFYCGLPQIIAISNKYEIPIRVLYRYGKQDQHEQIFNQQLSGPVITLAHLNGNHFEFFDD